MVPNIKVHKLKQKRLIIEASGNLLNIIGSCDIFVKIPFIKTYKTIGITCAQGQLRGQGDFDFLRHP